MRKHRRMIPADQMSRAEQHKVSVVRKSGSEESGGPLRTNGLIRALKEHLWRTETTRTRAVGPDAGTA